MINQKLPQIVSETLPGPSSRELLEKRKKYVAKGISCGTEVFVQEAKGALIKDVDGNVFLDFAAAIGVQNAGHCDDEVVEAVKSQTEKYIHPCFHVAMYEPYVAVSERLAEITPGKFEKKVMLANSGAEAVENSVKISRKYTKKTGILALETSFHGRTYMAMSLTSKVKPYKNGFGPFSPDTYKIPSAYCYRCPLGCKYPECGIACAEKLRTLLKGELSSDYIAALIAEPVQGEGGFIVPPKEYLQALQSICNENGIVFIVDEVQAGFARTGKLFASEHFGIEPDMMTLSKSIAAGVPLSAVVGKAEIMDAPGAGEIGGTYGGSPLACAAALKVMEKIDKDDLAKKAEMIGNILMKRLGEMKEKYPVIGDIRGLGAMVGMEFVKDQKTKEPYAEIIKQITGYAYNKGVLFLSAGIFSNVLRFLPPLVMTEEQVNYGMDILDEAIEKCIKSGG
ncbi:MAG: 4-aminobutyrate--2-oxoglutarate transaminase [Clostridia bacterium]|nr:4-aminobutyrate--2-oxoglutarate transaminase [Clostridia bacterium]